MSSGDGSVTQPFTDSDDVRRRMAEPEESPSRLSDTIASTHPFADSAELWRRAAEASSRISSAALYPPPPLPPLSSNLPIRELTEAFTNASLATVPDARLALACPRSSEGSDSVIIPLPGSVGGWDMIGVVQRTRDVDFAIHMPFWIRGFREPSQLICEQLRQFTVDISEAPPRVLLSLTKRPASGGEEVVIKRQRLEGDVSEILLAPAATLPQDASGTGAIKRPDTPSLGTITPARQISRPGITPLLDLLDGEVAIVRTTRPKNIETSSPSRPQAAEQAIHINSSAVYELRRVGGIANAVSSSLFVGQHSGVSNRIVAKVIRYEGKTAIDLAKCARKSIVSLKVFDARLLAVYIEHLPPSLHRGLNSPFQTSDTSIILHDTISALAYLETQGIVHNDIKPANITYSPQRGAVLIDFEMARALGDVWAFGITMLYVLGKMGLPERAVGSWRIRDVADERSHAYRRMMTWVDSVTLVRGRLNRADRIEGLVHRMLEWTPESRVRARQASAILEGTEEIHSQGQ
ncbi:kinase-like domain-containing protein [Achaetomium macrosporum]|uniref:Kinase-like domain-containing protein n=1 Tax=Achaetomium macrosporum TaxID=79813 RepID=A0AAN7CAH7_9PEZI|nr:kinase-like domain-containing protein [Achaetomium macrosporum]